MKLSVVKIMSLFMLLIVVSGGSSAHAERPNIVLCMADDQGWGDVGFRDHPVLKTPVMDELAATCLHFERFYAAAPVCSPTRGGVMTGRHPNRFACFSWGHTLRPGEITIAEALKTAGYRTGHFGKWHLGPVHRDSPVNPGHSGFDEWISAPNFFDNDTLLSDQGDIVQTHGESSIVTAELAIDFMRRAAADDVPFLAVVWFGSPHGPHAATEEYAALYADQPQREMNFYGEITAMDHAIGMLRDELKSIGISDDTIFWYTSDNGALANVGSTGGLTGRKGNLGEGGLRVPTMIEWPAQIKEPRTVSTPCNSVDIYPTLLDIVGVSIDDQPVLDGVSLLPIIEGNELPDRPPMGFWVHPTGGIRTPSVEVLGAMLDVQNGGDNPAAIPANNDTWKITRNYPTDEFPGRAAWIDGDWKLRRIVNRQGEVNFALFNLADDVAEQNNLFDDHPDRVEAMLSELTEWQTSVVNSLNGQDYHAAKWWKGNLHTHSLWSDGNDFPEMIADWYVRHGYNFLALSDHNILSEGDRWMAYEEIARRGGGEAVDKYLARFGDEWVEIRGDSETSAFQVRLKPLNEFRSLVETKGSFIMLQGEEISDSSEGVPVHLNASNLKELIPPVGGATVRETIQNNARAVQEQSARTGRPMLVHLNHPNFGLAVTAEDMAHATAEKFFEIYNGHPGVRQLGDADHPSVERLWDIANTIRIAQLGQAPLFGLGTDDSHNYHSRSGSTTGRGWVMVRARYLTPESLIQAINAGDFYSSSGVTLNEVTFNADAGELSIDIAGEEGVTYVTEFIGTLSGFDNEATPRVDADGDPIRATMKYSDEVGQVLATSDSLKPTYRLTGKELYVRARITSSRPHANPSLADQFEQAWTQPIGWNSDE